MLAPVAAWQLLPGSGAFLAMGHLVRRRDLRVAAENRRSGVTSALAITTRSDESRPLALAAIAERAYSA